MPVSLLLAPDTEAVVAAAATAAGEASTELATAAKRLRSSWEDLETRVYVAAFVVGAVWLAIWLRKAAR